MSRVPVARYVPKQVQVCTYVRVMGGDVVFIEQQFASVDCPKWSRRSFALSDGSRVRVGAVMGESYPGRDVVGVKSRE